MKVHHQTLKKAKAHGLAIEIALNGHEFRVYRQGTTENLAVAADPKDALDLAILELAGDAKDKVIKLRPKTSKAARLKRRRQDDMEDGEGDDEDDQGKSIVKSKYKDRYKPTHMTCGDDLALKLREEFLTKVDEDSSRPRLDFARFVAFAKANDVWVESYRKLKNRDGSRNDGLIRMNVSNRLRAAVRKGHKVVWGA